MAMEFHKRSCEARTRIGNTTAGCRQVAIVAVHDREGQVDLHGSHRREQSVFFVLVEDQPV